MEGDLGPNGRLVERFLERLAALDLVRWGDVIRVWRATLRRTDAWTDAEDAVGEAITRAGRHDAYWVLQDRLYRLFRQSPWHANPQAHGAVAGTEVAAQYLAGSATFALLMADALPPDALRTLCAPFAGVIPLAELVLPGEHRPGARVDDLPAA